MRRIRDTKPADKSKEKEKRDRLVQSIAVEQSVKTALISEVKDLTASIAKLRKEEEESLVDAQRAKENARKSKFVEDEASLSARNALAKVSEYEATITSLQSEIESLRTKISSVRNEYEAERALSIEVRRREDDEHAQHITLLRSQIADMQSRVDVLSKIERDITRSIEDKKLEQVGTERTLEFRLQELARVNMTVDSTKSEYEKTKEQYDLWGRRLDEIKAEFKKVDDAVVAKTNDVKKKSDEVERMREQLVALMAREKKIDERAQTIRDLFERAGLSVKL